MKFPELSTMPYNWLRWKQHTKKILISLIFLILLVLSIDFWNWHSPSLGIYNFPLWVWYGVILTLFLSPAYLLLIHFLWREP
jgi:hypothetical protein